MSRTNATVRDVALAAKVSTATVSRAFNQVADSLEDTELDNDNGVEVHSIRQTMDGSYDPGQTTGRPNGSSDSSKTTGRSAEKNACCASTRVSPRTRRSEERRVGEEC